MANWIETYRGAVPPWQCDVTEHFTVAYYFDRVEEARANLADALGFADLAKRGDIVRQVNARFARELRAGASFHLESAALPSDSGLRIAGGLFEFIAFHPDFGFGLGLTFVRAIREGMKGHRHQGIEQGCALFEGGFVHGNPALSHSVDFAKQIAHEKECTLAEFDGVFVGHGDGANAGHAGSQCGCKSGLEQNGVFHGVLSEK